jgi:hypothetical protein
MQQSPARRAFSPENYAIEYCNYCLFASALEFVHRRPSLYRAGKDRHPRLYCFPNSVAPQIPDCLAARSTIEHAPGAGVATPNLLTQ